MTRMVRKQFCIEPRQDEMLKKWAQETGMSEAEIFRQALDHWIASEQQRREAEAAWEEERVFIESRIAQGPVSGGQTWTREELYEERLSCYGRETD